MGNLDNWNRMAQPPEEMLKEIKSGRLRGKSDINPQWRLKKMTEIYGECGFGWWYAIDRLWIEKGEENESMAFAQIKLFIKKGTDISMPIPGIGGSKIIISEKLGMYNNDEAFKMAVTDALSVAMRALGVGANIYMGLRESKYSEPEEQSPETKDTGWRAKFLKSCEEIKPKLEPGAYERILEDFGYSTLDQVENRTTAELIYIKFKLLSKTTPEKGKTETL